MNKVHDTLSTAQIAGGAATVATQDPIAAKVTIIITLIQVVIKAIELFKKSKHKNEA